MIKPFQNQKAQYHQKKWRPRKDTIRRESAQYVLGSIKLTKMALCNYILGSRNMSTVYLTI
jgi:hypothetical protein